VTNSSGLLLYLSIHLDLLSSSITNRSTSSNDMSKFETCKAVIFNGIESLQYGDVEKPSLDSASETLLKVIVCGICGSDLHPYHGREPCALRTVFGHECVGQVVEKGDDVSSVDIGDIVVVPFSTACGNCFFCKNNLSARCEQSQLLGKERHMLACSK
jgi:threonine dehydrogenase-like Zn-dependent dehydrogenase